MQSSWPYIKDSGYFLRKIKQIGNLPENSIIVTEDLVGLYASTLHELGLKVLEDNLQESLIKLTKFVLQNNYFEFNEEVKQ